VKSFRTGEFSSIKPGGRRPTNWIEKLNQAVANEIDRAHWTLKKRNWPADLLGGAGYSARRPTFTVRSQAGSDHHRNRAAN